jgi:CSLREA domain-containing protein
MPPLVACTHARKETTMLRLLPFALTLLLAAPATAATFHVDSEADEVDVAPGDGVCASANDGCTLRAALQEANALAGPDTIRLPAGMYGLTHTGANEDQAASGDLDLRGRLRLLGSGTATTIVDGKNGDRVFDVLGRARVTLTKLTVRGGNLPNDQGGGIQTDSMSRVVLKRLLVEDNIAVAGGGVAALGHLKVVASTVRENTASVGGGLAVMNAEIRGSTFDGNLATGLAGSFTGHDIIAQGPGAVTIVNSTSTGQIQTASFCFPDGDCRDGADILLANVTANVVSRVVHGTDTGSFTLRNTIIEKCDTDLISQGYNLIRQEGCFIAGDLSGVVIGEDPLLSSLLDHGGPTATRVPVGVSPATDGGNPAAPGSGGTACEATDQRGVVRPIGDGCDIGAVEAH